MPLDTNLMQLPPPSPTSGDRTRFRAHALDGARLYFHPATGTNVRVETAATRHERRRAPRVAMFGITNACNLACAFCSRDVARPSRWTVESAAAALRGLAEAGTLEVAFGGGEPFAFAGFHELIDELHATTPLALHVTTNGTLITRERWRPFAGRFGQVRVSIYDDATWRRCAQVLAATGQRWGANLLVDAAALAALPGQLAALAEAGCSDVSILSYVGEPARRLGDRGRHQLASILAASPLPCRISVCFGAELAVPRLWAGPSNDGDCGAGQDFVSISPDQTVQSCSFQDRGAPAATADDILRAWHSQRAAWRAASSRAGCARSLPQLPAPPAPPIAIWQAFSGNNSGECILVARFATTDEAEAYLGELVPGWAVDAPYSAEWRALFERERVATPAMTAEHSELESPRELGALGATVVSISYGLGDSFPELRALAWKRGAYVVPGGIHEHDDPSVLLAIRGRDPADVAALAAGPRPPTTRVYRHGDVLFVTSRLVSAGDTRILVEAAETVKALAQDRPHAVELAWGEVTDAMMTQATQRLGATLPARQRLWCSFWSSPPSAAIEEAQRFAASLPDEPCTQVGRVVLIDPAARSRKRLAVLALRAGADVTALEGEAVELHATYWHLPPAPQKGRGAAPITLTQAQVRSALAGALPHTRDVRLSEEPHRRRWIRAVVPTVEPATTLRALAAAQRALACELNVGVQELDPLGHALRRLLADLGR